MVAKSPAGYRQYKSYKSKPEAQQIVNRLRKEGKTVTTREVAVKGKGSITRVFIK